MTRITTTIALGRLLIVHVIEQRNSALPPPIDADGQNTALRDTRQNGRRLHLVLGGAA